MTKMHIIAKIALTLLAINLLVYLLSNFNMLFTSAVGARLYLATLQRIVVSVALLSIPFIVVYYLLFRGDRVAQKLVGPTERRARDTNRTWLVVGFRLTLYFCAVMILAGCIDFLIGGVAFMIYGPRVLIDMIIHRYIDDVFAIGIYGWLGWFSNLCRTTLGLYLVLGAPHFVRWQMRKFDRQMASEIVGGEGELCP